MAAQKSSHYFFKINYISLQRKNSIIFMYRCLLIAFVFLFSQSCSEEKDDRITKIEFHILHARDKVVYVETIPYTDEMREVVDSVKIGSGDFKGFLTIKNYEERPFQLRVTDTDIRITLINDVPEILVSVNIIKPDVFTIEKSPANSLLKNFFVGQSKIAEDGKIITDEIKELKDREDKPARYDSLALQLDKNLEVYFSYVKNFADTISSPGVFLAVYNNVDFGKDFTGLNKFISRASNRFPKHIRIQKLKNETLEYLKIFEEEYEIGQLLPSVQLNDTSGFSYITALSRGKYVFLDVWASWCGTCLKYDDAKLKAKSKFPVDKFEIVSIGLEPDKETWKAYIRSKKLKWIQLVDEKIWNGTAQRTFKIDSIPFNFLLAPDGRILRKAIPPDSVLSVLSDYIR